MGSHLFLNSATVNNKSGGVMNWSGATAFRSNSGTNAVTKEAGGVINKVSAGPMALDDFANPFTFNNNGTVNLAGTGTLNLNRGGTDIGTYNISSGATLEFSVSRDFNSGISFTGAGALLFNGGTQTFDAAHTFAAAGPSVSISSGTLTSAFALDIQSAFDWQNAVVAGGGALNTAARRPTATMRRYPARSGTTMARPATPAALNMNSSTVNNRGGGRVYPDWHILLQRGVGHQQRSQPCRRNDSQEWRRHQPCRRLWQSTLQQCRHDQRQCRYAAEPRRHRHGTYNISSGATLDSTTNRDFNSGISFTGGGSLVFSGTSQTFGAAHTFAAAGPIVYVVNGGTLTSGSDLNFLGTLDWSGGTINGAGALNTSGATTIGVFCCNLNGKTWNNYGVATVRHLY